MELLTAVSLCSGYEGIGLGLRLVMPMRTVLYVENEPYCQRLLQARMRDGYLDDAPIWDDLTTFNGRPWRGFADVLFGGIPCQGWSVAGEQRGVDDERNLWPATARIIADMEPSLFFLENVPPILPYYYAEIRPRLQSMGYRTEEGIFSAVEVGAPHRRERFFSLAYARHAELPRRNSITEGSERAPCGEPSPCRDVAYAPGARFQTWRGTGVGNDAGGTFSEPITRSGEEEQRRVATNARSVRYGLTEASLLTGRLGIERCGWWSIEPNVGRVAHGIASRVDRLRATGNGVVPLVAAKAFRTLMGRFL